MSPDICNLSELADPPPGSSRRWRWRLILGLCLWIALTPSVWAEVRLTEFMADNTHGLLDEDFSHEDWIEVFNDGTNAVSLNGWSLTDSASNLTKWRFPATNIAPGQFILVFASNKDRRTPGAPLHTNFKLGAAGEYLALVRPDGVTIATEFAPAYPLQARDVSYGFASETTVTPLAKGAAAKWRVWTKESDFNNQSPGWNSALNYSLTGWSNSTSGLGWDDELNPVNLTPYFGSNASPRSLMFNRTNALYSRFAFAVSNVAGASTLRLRMKYNDGFIAWLNGSWVASSLAPTNPTWTSLAPEAREESLNAAWAVFNLPVTNVVQGTNLLAIQTFRAEAVSPALLLLPELDVAFPTSSPAPSYLFVPTPGLTNSSTTTSVPPGIELLSSAARPPGGPGSPSITVTSRVTQTLAPVTNVTLYYRLMFGSEIAVPMSPSTGGICTASIPTTGLAPGQMFRWRIEARDLSNNVGTGPLFLDANDDDRYYGTVALNPGETNSRLSVLHWFVSSYSAAATETGTRCSLYYLDQFYDNVIVTLHGQSTTSFPKKSHDFDFNGRHHFKWREGENQAKDVHLLSNWADKSKVRNTLAYEMFQRAGLPSHWAFPVRVQTNGGFHAILDLVEDGDDRYLDRVGLDPEGALYKVNQSTELPAGATWVCEKKSRRYEDTADLTAFCQAISPLNSMASRRSYAYDNVDLPATINYLAALELSDCHDQGHKNFYLYRDSDGTRQWRLLPWDVDLTFGHEWTFADLYFDDAIYTDTPLPSGDVNDLKNIIFNSPELNEMYLRRLRTLADEVLQPDAIPSSLKTNENRIDALLDLMDPPAATGTDADLDFAKWGWWTNSTQRFTANPDQEMRPQAQRIKDDYLPGRRNFLNNLNPTCFGAPIPGPQPGNAVVRIDTIDYNPASGNQDHEYVLLRNTNAFAIDVSGWEMHGAIDYVFPAGTVIPAGAASNSNVGNLFLARNPYAFRQRPASPTSNEYCLVSGPYAGQLSARGEWLTLQDRGGRLISSNSYVGTPSPAQQFLRITEIMYNPSPAPDLDPDAQQFEYLELRNISGSQALDLTGVRFTAGIQFAFSGATVTNLPPGARLVLVRNPVAFTARYGTAATIAGQFAGALDSNGETLRLEDAQGEKILEFGYDQAWYPITDGLGFSLVIRDDQMLWSEWDKQAAWRPSGTLNGSPGLTDPDLPAFPPVLVNEVLTHTDPPQVDSIELYNPTGTNVNIAGWFLTDDFYSPRKYRLPDATTISPGGYLTLPADTSFGTGTNAFLFSEYGEEVYLFSGDSQTNLTGYCHGYKFGAAPNGVSFGRHVDSQGDDHFVLQRSNTLGAVNSPPLVGPVVIAQIMYHPPDYPGAIDNDLDEFIELQNLTSNAVPLLCTFTNEPGYGLLALTNTWHLRNAVDFDFPPNSTLAPEGQLFIVGFNPTNATQLAAFRALYNLPTNTPVLGPWSGKLDNSRDTVELKYPDRPDLTGSNVFVPYVVLDQVTYRQTPPWPTNADGTGLSLQRRTLPDFGNDPLNWRAASVPGTTATDADNDGMADWWEIANGLNTAQDDASLDADGDGMNNLAEFLGHTNPQAAGDVLQLIPAIAPQGNVILSFIAQADVGYTVQFLEPLGATNWQPWLQVAPAPTNRTIITTNLAPLAPRRFFRVTTPPVP